MQRELFHNFLLLATISYAEATTNKSRGEKVFSLFSIIQFPNQACTSTSEIYSNGTCYTSNECSSRGGSAQGNCAAGFGVCCVFFFSATGSIVSQNNSYIVNPNFPSNFATAGTITYTISKESIDICRIRLDYDTFILTQPTAVTTTATAGQCDTDRLTFQTTDRTTVPAVGAAGTASYGDYPYLCGTNTGLHSYLDLSCTDTDDATLTFTLGDTTLNQWKIKVTQLSCDDSCVASQQGCFQYFTGITGTIQSYNLAGELELVGQNYKNCIRQEAGYCCIEYVPTSFQLGTATCADAANRCASASSCLTEYVIIPGVTNPSGVAQPDSYDRFCGSNLSPTGTSAASDQPVTSCTCPFEVTHVTGITALNAAMAAVAPGFSLNYRQIPGNC